MSSIRKEQEEEEKVSKKENATEKEIYLNPKTLIPQHKLNALNRSIVEKIGIIMFFILGFYFTYDSRIGFALMLLFYMIFFFFFFKRGFFRTHDSHEVVSQKKDE